MSAIDQYKHKLLGFINCPSDYPIVYESDVKQIAIYQLEENIPIDEISFDGKIGDLILGGGSGEASCLRISIPEMIKFEFEEYDSFEHRNELRKSFWSPNESYVYCNGFLKLGWNPSEDIEFWLAENTIKYLIYTNKFNSEIKIDQDELCPGLFTDSTYLKIQITRFVEHHQPDIIEFSFLDYEQYSHKIIDKIPNITDKNINEDSSYPIEEFILIDILNVEKENGKEIYSFQFKESYGLESVEGKTNFKIRKDQITIK